MSIWDVKLVGTWSRPDTSTMEARLVAAFLVRRGCVRPDIQLLRDHPYGGYANGGTFKVTLPDVEASTEDDAIRVATTKLRRMIRNMGLCTPPKLKIE